MVDYLADYFGDYVTSPIRPLELVPCEAPNTQLAANADLRRRK